MNAGEFHTIMVGCGVGSDWLGGYLHVNPRTVRNWEWGKYPVPEPVAQEMRRLWEHTQQRAAQLVQQTRDNPGAVVRVLGIDDTPGDTFTGSLLPYTWHNQVIAHAFAAAPDLPIAPRRTLDDGEIGYVLRVKCRYPDRADSSEFVGKFPTEDAVVELAEKIAADTGGVISWVAHACYVTIPADRPDTPQVRHWRKPGPATR
jgi:hypothetical protein